MALLKNAGRGLTQRLTEIEAQVGKVERYIDFAARRDVELASGLATTRPIAETEKLLVKFEAAIESLTRDIRTASEAIKSLT